jgi:hypothetical protein
VLVCYVEKEIKGEHFTDLEMITQLISAKRQNKSGDIEEEKG